MWTTVLLVTEWPAKPENCVKFYIKRKKTVWISSTLIIILVMRAKLRLVLIHGLFVSILEHWVKLWVNNLPEFAVYLKSIFQGCFFKMIVQIDGLSWHIQGTKRKWGTCNQMISFPNIIFFSAEIHSGLHLCNHIF